MMMMMMMMMLMCVDVAVVVIATYVSLIIEVEQFLTFALHCSSGLLAPCVCPTTITWLANWKRMVLWRRVSFFFFAAKTQCLLLCWPPHPTHIVLHYFHLVAFQGVNLLCLSPSAFPLDEQDQYAHDPMYVKDMMNEYWNDAPPNPGTGAFLTLGQVGDL